MSEAPKKVCKSYPHACPVCKGRGELTEELAQHEAVVKYDLGDRKIYSCHVCQGQCMIWEYRDEDVPEEHWPNQIAPLQLPPTLINPSILTPIQPYQQPIIDPNIGPMTIGDPPSPWGVSVSWGTSNIPPSDFKFKMDNGNQK